MSTPAERSARAKLPTVSRMVVAQERRERALELRIAGMSERAIAKEIGISNGRAHQLLAEGAEMLKASVVGKADDVRRLELERCDRMTLALFSQRQNPRAADTLLRIMERRAKLLGLDSPVRSEVTGADGEALGISVTFVGKNTDEPIDITPESADFEVVMSNRE